MSLRQEIAKSVFVATLVGLQVGAGEIFAPMSTLVLTLAVLQTFSLLNSLASLHTEKCQKNVAEEDTCALGELVASTLKAIATKTWMLKFSCALVLLALGRLMRLAGVLGLGFLPVAGMACAFGGLCCLAWKGLCPSRATAQRSASEAGEEQEDSVSLAAACTCSRCSTTKPAAEVRTIDDTCCPYQPAFWRHDLELDEDEDAEEDGEEEALFHADPESKHFMTPSFLDEQL